MPFLVTKNKKSDSYKVVNKLNGKVYAYATKNPQKLIAAIEINKLLTKKIKNKNK
jgi:hypothetical protein